ncbi:MAG: response regulator [Rhodospirillaceae bacterium]
MPDARLPRLTVLVIEDEPFTRTVTARVVAGLGCAAVLEAGDAVTGLQLLRCQRVDIVLCDIDMKPVTGLELLRDLRTSDDEAERRLPLIFLTGRAGPEEVAAANTLGRTAFLVKPVQPDLLRRSLLQLTETPAA